MSGQSAGWIWVADQLVFDTHDVLIQAYGGMPGVKDRGLVLSALARPLNAAAYGSPGVFELAAEYLHGLATRQGFHDGNKRTAWAVMEAFLNRNGVYISFDFLQAENQIAAIATRQMTVPQIAAWLRTL